MNNMKKLISYPSKYYCERAIAVVFLTLILYAFTTPIYAQDSDGDGINDNVDLDDDNDGILDTNN